MAKSIYKVFKTSTQAENNGQWFNYGEGPTGRDQRILLARMGPSNKRFSAAYERFQREFGRQVDSGTLANETARAAMVEMMADSIVLNWEGICDENGQELPYSRENVIKVLTDLPEFFHELRDLASKREHYLEQQDREDAGN